MVTSVIQNKNQVTSDTVTNSLSSVQSQQATDFSANSKNNLLNNAKLPATSLENDVDVDRIIKEQEERSKTLSMLATGAQQNINNITKDNYGTVGKWWVRQAGWAFTGGKYTKTIEKELAIERNQVAEYAVQKEKIDTFLKKAKELKGNEDYAKDLENLCKEYADKKISIQSEFAKQSQNEFAKDYKKIETRLNNSETVIKMAKAANELGGMMALYALTGGAPIVAPLIAGAIHAVNEGVEQGVSVGYGVKTQEQAMADFKSGIILHVSRCASRCIKFLSRQKQQQAVLKHVGALGKSLKN